MGELILGQRVYFVPKDQRRVAPFEATVTRLGRKWAEITQDGALRFSHRINVNTLEADGGQFVSPGRCWLSIEDYRNEVVRQQAWTEFLLEVSGNLRVPKHLSVDAIAQLMLVVSGENSTPGKPASNI